MSVLVTLETAAVEVEPASTRDLHVRIRNTGQIVDRFTVTVLGDAAAWTSVTPNAVSLFPGAEEAVRLTFAPPRGSSPRAGRTVFGVQVRAAENPADSVVEEGSVTVLPFTATTATLTPQTSRGSGRARHDVSVANGGNVPVEVALVPADPDRLLSFEVRPDRLRLEPGATGAARLAVRPIDTFLLGQPQSRPFGVTVTSSGQAPFEIRGTMLQSARLPNWLPKAVAGIAVLAVVGGVMAATVLQPPPPPSASPTATQVATIETDAPTPSAQASAGPSVPPTSAPSAPPTPPPSVEPGPFELSFVADPGVTNGALSSNCPVDQSDDPCVGRAVDTVRALVSTLGGPFEGKGIVSTNDPLVTNALPVVVERDMPFTWLAQQGTTTDQTERVVIDLAPLLANPKGFAYAVVDAAGGGVRRFVLPDELAGQLLETLYIRNPDMVDPLPVRSLPPVFVPFDPGDLQWEFFIATPPP